MYLGRGTSHRWAELSQSLTQVLTVRTTTRRNAAALGRDPVRISLPVTAARAVEGAEEIHEGRLPAVITCEKGLNEPRYASLKGIMQAKKKPIETKSPAEVGIDPESLDVRFRVIGSDLWSDDEGFVSSIGAFGITGICGSGIIEVVAEMFLAGVITADGVVDGSLAERSDRLVPDGRTYSFLLHDGKQRIAVTQTDVRQIQLAKAALYAGVKLLMDRAGIDTVDRIRLAGAYPAVRLSARHAARCADKTTR